MTIEKLNHDTEKKLDQFLQDNESKSSGAPDGEYHAIMNKIHDSDSTPSQKVRPPFLKWFIPSAASAILVIFLFQAVFTTEIVTSPTSDESFSYSLGVYDETNSDDFFLPVGEEYVLLAEAVSQN